MMHKQVSMTQITEINEMFRLYFSSHSFCSDGIGPYLGWTRLRLVLKCRPIEGSLEPGLRPCLYLMSTQNGSSCWLTIESLSLCTATCWLVNRTCTGGFWTPSASLLQASDIHLHPIVEGEDGGSAGGVAPLFYIADGLIEVFPTREASDRRVGRTWALWCCWYRLLLLLLWRLLLPFQSSTSPTCAVIVSPLLPLPVSVDTGVRGVRFDCSWWPGPVSHWLVAGLLLGTSLALDSSASAPGTLVPPLTPKGAWEGFCAIVLHGRFLFLGFAYDGISVCNLRTQADRRGHMKVLVKESTSPFLQVTGLVPKFYSRVYGGLTDI